ncbi:MAG: hypothetical protein ACTSRZ_20560 [Promethearchaeota archaeon]
MPEADPPNGVERGSLEHQLFITLMVSIDYLRDAHKLWDSARRAYEKSEYKYIFNPHKLIDINLKKIAKDLKETGMSARFSKEDAKIIQKVASGLIYYFDGKPENIINQANYDGKKALDIIRSNKYKKSFPYLKGKKIGSLWVRMLKDVCKMPINLLNVPIAVDVHIARASFTSGALTGEFKGTINGVRENIEELWFKVAELMREKGEIEFNALKFDEPLWTLSKFGCQYRKENINKLCRKYSECPIQKFCVNGLIKVFQRKDGVQIKTTL